MHNLNSMGSAQRFMVFARNTETNDLFCLTYADSQQLGLYAWPVDLDSFELVAKCGVTKSEVVKFVSSLRKFASFFEKRGLDIETVFVRKVMLRLIVDDQVDKKIAARNPEARGPIKVVGSTCHFKSHCISFTGQTKDSAAFIRQLTAFVAKHFGLNPEAKFVSCMSDVGIWKTVVHLTFAPDGKIKLGTVRRIVQDAFDGL